MGGSSTVMVASTWWNGAYRSFDAGHHWEPIPDFPPVSEARVAFDPNDPLVGYVYGFGGVARTTDGGHTWRHVLETFVTYRLAIGPDGGVAASARDGQSYTRILYSSDRGTTWTDIGFPYGGTQYMSLYGLAFGATEDVVVAMNIARMWRTADGGATWTETSHTFLDLQRAPDGTLWAGGFGIAKSADGGATWQSVPAPASGWPIGVGTAGQVFVPSHAGFLVSGDGGASWTDLGHADAAFGATQLFVDPADPASVFVSDEFIGIARVGPDGYESRTTGLQPIDVVALGGSADGSVLLAGTALGAYVSRDGGDSWSHSGAGHGMMGTYAVGANADGSVLLVGGQARIFWPYLAVSHDGGRTWDVTNPQLGGDGYISGFAFDPSDPLHAYASATMDLAYSKLIETRDGGLTWTVAFTLPEFDIWDVAWDHATGKPLLATELGVLVYDGNGLVTPRGAGLDSRAVATLEGRSWSGGPAPSVWSGADGAPHAPFADTGAAVLDLAPESRDAVWAASAGGAVSRCVLGSCADVSPPHDARAVLVRADGGAVFAGTTDGGIYRAFI